MPFELGLAWALSEFGRHACVVLEANKCRLQKSLSDLNGIDPHIHDGQPQGVLRELTNAFVVKRGKQPTVTDLMYIYRELRQQADVIRRVNLARDLYNPHCFRDLVLATVNTVSRRQHSAS